MVVWWWKNIMPLQNIQLNHLSLHNLWILPYTNALSHHWTLGGMILCIIFFKSIYTINYRQQGYKNVRWDLRKNLGLKTCKFRRGGTCRGPGRVFWHHRNFFWAGHVAGVEFLFRLSCVIESIFNEQKSLEFLCGF